MIPAVPEPLWAPWRLEYIAKADEQDECIFCAPDEELLVHRGERALVLLNKFPYSSGHLMVAPMRHTGDFASLDRDEAARDPHARLSAMGALGRSTRRRASTSAGTSAGSPAPASSTTCTCTSCRAGRRHELHAVLADVKVLPEHLLETARRLRGSWPG